MDKLAAIASSPLFEMLSREELEHLAELCQEQPCAPGEVLFEEGQPGDSLFLIVRGQVEVLGREGASPRSLAVLGPSEFFGEMSLIDKDHRSATLRAKTDAQLLRFTLQGLTTFRESHPEGFTFIVINIARTLSARLREANARPPPSSGESSR
jgi:CRP/FNR family transcriptional regulator, cyclic AMP receptor protein